MQTIFGALPIQSGSVTVHGESMTSETIHKAMKEGIGMIPANRKENSVIPDMTLLENTYISRHTIDTRNPSINKRAEESRFTDYKKTLNIKANRSDNLIVSLSGGNQQKVILARWLDTDAQILLMDNPTQGIDVGAKEEIYRLILKLAEGGKTIIVNTLEIPELKKIADRCIVFYHGAIVAELPHAEIEENNVMMYSTGAK
jgi:ribose transport system ATP-binding protein